MASPGAVVLHVVTKPVSGAAPAGRWVTSRASEFEAVLLLPAGSSTPPSGMRTVRLPAARPETAKVNSAVPLAGSGSETVPPDASTSE